MGLFKRGPGKDAVETTALVVDAEAPLQNHGAQWGNTNECAIRLLVDAGAGPQLVTRRFHLGDDQWLVAGMDAPVTVDLRKPERFEVEWERVAGIEARVAAGDAALVDPLSARARVRQALNAAGVLPGFGDAGLAFAGEDHFGRFAGAIEQAAAAGAPAGRRQAVTTVASVRMRLRADGSSGNPHAGRTCAGPSDTVLAVAVPGAAPFAVLERELDKPDGLGDLSGAALPATVAESDPRDVQVRWDLVRAASPPPQAPDVDALLEQQMAIYRQWQQGGGGQGGGGWSTGRS